MNAAHSTLTEIERQINTTTSLADRLRARIRSEGPITFRDWMEAALYDDHEGYYCRSDLVRWGRAGDYRTGPETSPLFATTFARYFAKLFAELGSPPSWTIFEVGAGAGEFARGVLSSLKSFYPAVFVSTRYIIDEVSADCRTRAALRLCEFNDRVEFLSFSEIVEAVTNGIVFSNELIDALPVHRVTSRKGKFRELCVGLDEDKFVWVDCDPDKRLTKYCERADLRPAEDQIVEVNLAADDFISDAALSIARGFVITVDYGAERDQLLNAAHRQTGTLRAIHRHQFVDDLLANAGEQDLTTTVDWTQIKEAGQRAGLQSVRYESLHRFLLDEGLLDEIEKLASARQSNSEVLRLRTGAREMIMPHGLAASFQILVQKKS